MTTSDGNTGYVLVKLTIPLPGTTAQPEVKVVEKNKRQNDMMFHNWYYITSPQCEPVEPEPVVPPTPVARTPSAEEKEILEAESVRTLV